MVVRLRRRIGEVRVKRRRVDVEPMYYYRKTEARIGGHAVEVEISPFDGEFFLPWQWCWQDDRRWMRRCGSFIEAAAIDLLSMSDRDKSLKERESLSLRQWFAFFSFQERSREVRIGYGVEIEGKWIGGDCTVGSVLTVLETTRVKVQLSKEEHLLRLLPGTVTVVSPEVLLKKVNENVPFKNEGLTKVEEYLENLFSSSRTPQELAARLGLEPIRLQNTLAVDESKNALCR